jgi:hypothetical protein
MMKKQVKIHLTNGTVLDNIVTEEAKSSLSETIQLFKQLLKPDAVVWGELTNGNGFVASSEKIQYIEFIGFPND